MFAAKSRRIPNIYARLHKRIALVGATCYNQAMSLIHVLLVDDHVLLRQGTRELLEHEKDIEVIAEADDGVQAVRLAAELRPDVVIMDAAMDGLNGVEATRQIKTHRPDTAVLMLSAYDSDAFVFASLEAGATGYLLKSCRADELVQAVRTVHAGGSALHPDIARKLVDRFTRSGEEALAQQTATTPEFTERELEVLRLTARGMTNRDIAQALSIGLRTVQAHLSSLFNKTGTRSRTEVVVKALRQGWISLEETEEDPVRANHKERATR